MRLLTREALDKAGVEPKINAIEAVPGPARALLVESFIPGIDFRWMTAGDDADALLEEGSPLAEKHRELSAYMIECILRFGEQYGHVLCCRDEDGTFLGSLCLVPPYSSRKLFTAHFMRAVVPLGRPVPEKLGDDVNARFKAFGDALERSAEHLLSEEGPCWYIANLGVVPSAQGKGVGRRLVAAAAAIAGDGKLSLECHDDNVTFYEKLGFDVFDKPLITAPPPSQDGSLQFNVMVRKGE